MTLKILADLEFEAALLRVKREVLKVLLDKGKISANTFNLLSERVSEIEKAVVNLRELIDHERKFWGSISSEETRILESLLVDFRLLNMVGEVSDGDWLSISKTIEMGIRPHKSQDAPSMISKNNICMDATQFRRRQNNAVRRDRRVMEKPARLEEVKPDSKIDSHCMNPWKPSCRRTDIKLSIYYNGQFLPICHECWREISEKNLEWTAP